MPPSSIIYRNVSLCEKHHRTQGRENTKKSKRAAVKLKSRGRKRGHLL